MRTQITQIGLVLLMVFSGNLFAQMTSVGHITQQREGITCLQLPIVAAMQPLLQLRYALPGDPEVVPPVLSKWWSGGLAGFGIGAAGGAILGLSGLPWVLASGDTVPLLIHSVIDAMLVATPLTIIGVIVGTRQPRSTLVPSQFHIGLHGGYSGVAGYADIHSAFDTAGFDPHIPHWFGYLHYPSGSNSSVPYTWNLTVDHNPHDHIGVGYSFNKFVKQEVNGANDEREFVEGGSHCLFIDYVWNPIEPSNESRIQTSTGVGIALHAYQAGGDLGTTTSEFLVKTTQVSPVLRAYINYFARKRTSLQLKIGYKFKQTIEVEGQTEGMITLPAHTINVRSVEFTLGIVKHFNLW